MEPTRGVPQPGVRVRVVVVVVVGGERRERRRELHEERVDGRRAAAVGRLAAANQVLVRHSLRRQPGAGHSPPGTADR